MRQILILLLFLSLAIVGVAQNTPYTRVLSPNPFPYRWVRVFEFAGNQRIDEGFGKVGITDDSRCIISFINGDTNRFFPTPLSIHSMNINGEIVGPNNKLSTVIIMVK